MSMEKLKLRKNDFGLRVTCSTCNKTFNEDSISNCKHYGKQKYKVIIYEPGGSTKVKTLKTRDYNRATEEAVKFKNQVKEGKLTLIAKNPPLEYNAHNLLLIQAADEYLNQKKGKVKFTFKKKPDLSKDYIYSIFQYMTEFIQVLSKGGYSVNHMYIEDVKDEHIEVWWVDLNNKYHNPSTINARIRALRGFFNYIIQTHNLKIKNTFKEVQLLEELSEIRSISKREFDAICDAVENHCPFHYFISKKGKKERRNRYRPYLLNVFKLGLLTGLRREELFELKWSDIKREEDGKNLLAVRNLKVERITKKKYKLKYVPLYGDLHDFLLSIGLEAKIGEDTYILHPNRTEAINTLKECTSRAFTFYYSKAFPDSKEIIGFKSLRKTYLTYLAKHVGSDAIYLSSHSTNDVLERHYIDPKVLRKGEGMKMFD
jgi:integrase